jgi:hypothetical protein
MPNPSWKTWPRILVLIVLGLAAAYGVYLYRWMTANRGDFAEADRLDPGWRLHELEKKRQAIPDEENGALMVLEAARLWPAQSAGTEQGFWDESGMEQSIVDLPPEVQLNVNQRESLKQELEKTSAALQAARKLRQLSRGRFPNNESEGDRQSAFQESRRVATLLQLDSNLKAQDSQPEEALLTAVGILNCGRSIGDEPSILSQFVRMGCDMLFFRQTERVLAQGDATDKSLQAAQELLRDEASQPLLLFGVRGERAQTFEKMGGISGLFMQMQFRGVFRLQTKCVEAVKAPPEEQLARLQEIKPVGSKLDPLSSLWLSSHEKSVRIYLRNQASLRCSYVALAVERFRRSHGHWPDSLSVLVPEFLPELPADPYNGSPSKFGRRKFDRQNPTAPGTDLGFQLWDVAQRRQPWRPVLKKAPDEAQK